MTMKVLLMVWFRKLPILIFHKQPCCSKNMFLILKKIIWHLSSNFRNTFRLGGRGGYNVPQGHVFVENPWNFVTFNIFLWWIKCWECFYEKICQLSVMTVLSRASENIYFYVFLLRSKFYWKLCENFFIGKF